MSLSNQIEKIVQLIEGKKKFIISERKTKVIMHEFLEKIFKTYGREEICLIVKKAEVNYLENIFPKIKGVKRIVLESVDYMIDDKWQWAEQISQEIVLLLSEDGTGVIRWKLMNALKGKTVIYYNDYFDKNGFLYFGEWSYRIKGRIKKYVKLIEIKRIRSIRADKFAKIVAYRSPDYKLIFIYQRLYHEAILKEWKNYYCEKLIEQYLICRDFKNAKKWINKAKIEIDSQKFQMVENKVCEFLYMISEKLRNNKEKQIVINWIDSLKYKELTEKKECSYLYDKKENENVIFFENAYTVMPWTHWTMYVMFSGQLPIESSMHKFKKIDENMLFMKIMNKWNYRYTYIGTPRFFEMYKRKHLKEFANVPNGSLPCSYIMFSGLEQIIKKTGNNCILLHNLLETHSPFWNGRDDILNLKWTKWTEKEQEMSLKYIVEQIEWYDEYFDMCDSTKIYMSDHGKDRRVLTDDRTHITFIIEGRNIQKEIVKGLFSIKDFPYIVENIICRGGEYEKYTGEFIELQSLDYYNEHLINKVFENKLEKSEWMQQRGIRTKSKKYLLFADGEEIVYNLNDESINEINSINKKELDYLRQMAGDKFIDIYKDDFFVNTRKLYENIGDNLMK